MRHQPGSVDALARELAGLFGLSLPAAATSSELSCRFAEAVAADPRRRHLEPLLARLTASDSLLCDLAEILFLPRGERSEYLDSPPSPGPWLFPKLMLEYAVWSRRIDETAGRLLAPFCAHHCPTPPIGCCHQLGYDMGLVPPGMLRLQELEARLGGWSMPPQPDLAKCRYHRAGGCALRLFKSPACLQYLCRPLVAALEERYQPARVRELRESLHSLGCCDIDRARVFARMTQVVRAAERLQD